MWWGILTALYERERTGRGQFVRATLYESVAFLVGQHMTYAAVTGEPCPPMPERVSAWAVYQLFATRDGEQVFIGVTSDKQWERFCEVFGFQDLLQDERLNTNNRRIAERGWLLAELGRRIGALSRREVMDQAERAGIPFAPVARPEDLFDDPQMNEGGSLVETELPGGIRTKLPRLPLRLGDYDFKLRNDPPRVGEGARELLGELGLSEEELARLEQDQVIVLANR